MNSDLRAQFDKIDTDKDGFITTTEFVADLQSEGSKATEEQLKRIVEAADVDTNGDKLLSFEEYSAFVRDGAA